MADYRLSEAAATDLEEIVLFGFKTFGVAQTLRYQERLEAHLARIARQPLLYQRVDNSGLDIDAACSRATPSTM